MHSIPKVKLMSSIWLVTMTISSKHEEVNEWRC